MVRNSLGNSTEGHKAGINPSAGSLRFGIGGRGETLREIRTRILNYDDGERSISYFLNHTGLFDEVLKGEKGLEIERRDDEKGVRRTYVKSYGKWYEYYDFVRSQIEHSMRRGFGSISWPNIYSEVSLEEYLEFVKKEVANALEKIAE